MRRRAVVLPAIVLLALAGCVDDPAPVPTSSSPTATPTPTGTATPAATPSAAPTAEPLEVDCVSLVPADAFAMLFRDFTLVPGYAPPADSVLQQVLDADGTVCGWQATDGSTVGVGVAALDADELLAKKNDLVVSSNSVPTYGVEGYFRLVGPVGEVQAFADPSWIVATSTVFLEPGEAEPIVSAAIDAVR